MEKITAINYDAIREVLRGDFNRMNKAFMWNETPQGFTFWHYTAATRRLTEDGRAYLEELLRTEPKEEIKPPGESLYIHKSNMKRFLYVGFAFGAFTGAIVGFSIGLLI